MVVRLEVQRLDDDDLTAHAIDNNEKVCVHVGD